MLLPLAVGAILVLATVIVHYEALRITSDLVPRLHVPVRLRMLGVVIVYFAAHTVEVWIYAVAYYGLSRAGLGRLEGHVDHTLAEHLYFSLTSYSTLGFGDIYPTGALRLIAGIEGVNGLFLVAWSTSFTYLAMEKLWPLHLRRRGGGEEAGR